MIKGSILFDINKKVNLQELDERVRSALGARRWETTPNKRGFSGLELDTVDVDGVMYNRVLVVWTDDGHNGYIREDLTDLQINRIKEVINGQP